MTNEAASQRPRPRTREAVVLTDKAQKTRVVQVARLYRHPSFHKVIKRRVKYSVHDEKNESHVGDRIRIIEARPLSGSKRWRMVELIEKAKR